MLLVWGHTLKKGCFRAKSRWGKGAAGKNLGCGSAGLLPGACACWHCGGPKRAWPPERCNSSSPLSSLVVLKLGSTLESLWELKKNPDDWLPAPETQDLTGFKGDLGIGQFKIFSGISDVQPRLKDHCSRLPSHWVLVFNPAVSENTNHPSSNTPCSLSHFPTSAHPQAGTLLHFFTSEFLCSLQNQFRCFFHGEDGPGFPWQLIVSFSVS